MKMRKTLVFCVAFLGFLWASSPIVCQVPAAARARVAVFGFSNVTGDSTFDVPAETSTDTLVLSMRMLALYDVQASNLILRNINSDSLSRYCKDNSIDFVLYGSLSGMADGSQKYTLSLFDNSKSATTISETASGETVLDCFGVTDNLILSILSSVTGRHIGFGSLRFVNEGEPLDFEVSVDGVFLDKNPDIADRILSGNHSVCVYQGTGQARREIHSQTVILGEGKSETVKFSLEKEKAPDPQVIVQTVYVEKRADKPIMVPVSAGMVDLAWSRSTSGGFYISATEITQEQYRAVMGVNPGSVTGDDLPVDTVSFYDALEFCNRLSEREGLTPAYVIGDNCVVWNTAANGYRLPSEDEWAFAAYGGGIGKVTVYAGSDKPDGFAWYRTNRAHAVGGLAPNALGLFDMSGNLSEWCWRFSKSDSRTFGSTVTSNKKKSTNPQSWVTEYLPCAVVRGGSWENDNPENLRIDHVSSPSAIPPWARWSTIGFRVCRSFDPERTDEGEIIPGTPAPTVSSDVSEKTAFGLFAIGQMGLGPVTIGSFTTEDLTQLRTNSIGGGLLLEHRFSESSPFVFAARVQGSYIFPQSPIVTSYFDASAFGGLALRLPPTGPFIIQPEIDCGVLLHKMTIGATDMPPVTDFAVQFSIAVRYYFKSVGFELAPSITLIPENSANYLLPGIRTGLVWRFK